ncbi:tetratricopeptide repeat protein [Luteolibacter algae]|uniref:Tetratricopeptide repeat protein n=1 Tax=Luteolibacter algae TaxID=454151 RepID=A0ABW5D8A6_9BACT
MRYEFLIVLGAALTTPLAADSLLSFTLGALEKHRGNQEKASEHLHEAYRQEPTSLPLARIEIQRHLSSGDKIAAKKIYREMINAFPEDYAIQMEYGDFLGGISRGESADTTLQKEVYTKLLKKLPGDYVVLERLVRLAREHENDDEARILLEQLNTESPEATRFYITTTKSLYDSRDARAADRINKCFEKALDSNPEWAEVARAASDHFRSIGRLDLAISVLQKHVASVPSSLDLKIRLGILLLEAGNDREAVEVLNGVLSVHPKKTLAHQVLAKHFRQQNELDLSRYHSAELLKLRGGSPEEFLELSEEFIEGSDYRSARLLLEKAVFDHEKDIRLLTKLAIATLNDPETKADADRLFRQVEALAGDIDQSDPVYVLEAAKRLMEMGETRQAEEKLKEAIRTFPKSARKETAGALRALAEIWLTEGRNEAAARALIKRATALEKD